MQNKPVRIQKVLSEYGILSRRQAEEAIARGRITVNGHPCLTGQPINPKRDIVTLDGKRLEFKKDKKNVVVMLNKPRGVITTTKDEAGRKSVLDLLDGLPQRVYPVGRLDRNSEGLLLLTNDGELANALTHPSHHIGKTYRVTVRSLVSEEQLIKLSTGVRLEGDDKPTLPASVHLISTEQGRSVLGLTIYEGRNRQVRRMCEAVGLEVSRLRRASIGPVKLGMLPPGRWRLLTPAELMALRNAVKQPQDKRKKT
ncbi:MAG: rRNA pseudouridine synthase [Oscillospiraceae bacterium]|nr:rRNA pseudouridine synthase [Oscillospiraceae bacterium]